MGDADVHFWFEDGPELIKTSGGMRKETLKFYSQLSSI